MNEKNSMHHNSNEIVIIEPTEEERRNLFGDSVAVNPDHLEVLSDQVEPFEVKTIVEPVVFKSNPELLREEAEAWSKDFLSRNTEDKYAYRDEESYRRITTVKTGFLVTGYLAGYEAAEKSIRAELSAPKIPNRKSKRPTKSSKKSGAKKLSPVRKTNKQTNKTSSRTKRNTKARKGK